VKEALGRVTTDFIGINYYSKAIMRWRAKGDHFETAPGFPFGVGFSDPGQPVSEMGWSFHPEGLRRMIRFVRTYGLPVYITENGIADGADNYRGNYVRDHLRVVATELEQGADIRGYFYWSLLDNFEWVKGFRPRFGLVEVNYETFKRSPRPSFYELQKIISLHQEGHSAPSSKVLK
jgi:beta-glucosidase/6-phospho-beta-glucosidase/beta-galactosidase